MSIFSPFFNKLRANKKVRELVFRFRPSHKTLTFFHNLALPKKTRNPVLRELDAIKKQLDAIEFRQKLVMNHFLDISKAKEATGYVRTRQQISLEIFKEFIRLCDIAKIDYWLDFGSLIGAVRHGKIIPWDDDIDVSILLPDLDKFAEVAKKHINEGFDFKYSEEISQIRYKDVAFDIFTYKDNSDRIKSCYYSSMNPHCNRSIPKEIVFPVTKVMFAGIEASVPKDYDKYLRFQFGNYEKFPEREHPWVHFNHRKEYIVFYPDEKF